VTTRLPSAAAWLATLTADPNFSFLERGGIARLLENPHLYDRLLVDISRHASGPYHLSWLESLSSYTVRTLNEMIVRAVMQDKDVTLYTGGLHGTEINRYLELISKRTARDELARILRPLRAWRGNPKVSVCMDASGGGSFEYSREVRSHVAHIVADLGHRCVVEAYARPGRSISHFPSVSTAAFLDDYPLPAEYEPGAHGVLITSRAGLHRVPEWRKADRPIYLHAHDIGPDIPLPDWWHIPEIS
jgi:hypothetical protein